MGQNRHIPDSQRILTPAERAVLVWLREHHEQSYLDLQPSGRPGFHGWVLDAPRCTAATFLSLLARELVEPATGFGTPADVASHDDKDEADQVAVASKVVQLRHAGWRTALAKWFFRLSQRISDDSLRVEPHGFALVLIGRDKLEVLHYGLSENERAHAAVALFRLHAPGLAGLPRTYSLSPRGRAVLEISDMEEQIGASQDWPGALLIERHKKIDALPRKGQAAHKATGLTQGGA